MSEQKNLLDTIDKLCHVIEQLGSVFCKDVQKIPEYVQAKKLLEENGNVE